MNKRQLGTVISECNDIIVMAAQIIEANYDLDKNTHIPGSRQTRRFRNRAKDVRAEIANAIRAVPGNRSPIKS